MFSVGSVAQERMDIINRRAKGWRIAQYEPNEILGSIGLRIEKTKGLFPVDYKTDENATEWVVVQAWGEDPLCLLALDLLKEHCPENYLKAIRLAHGASPKL